VERAVFNSYLQQVRFNLNCERSMRKEIFSIARIRTNAYHQNVKRKFGAGSTGFPTTPFLECLTGPMGNSQLDSIGVRMGCAVRRALLVMLVLSACSNPTASSPRYSSRAEKDGLIVEFVARCTAGSIELVGSIANSTQKPIRIDSGTLPWESDVLGTEFVALSSGRKINRSWVSPILGRIGPLTLLPGERLEGETNIDSMFPGMQLLLGKAAVQLTWRYLPTSMTASKPTDMFVGHLELDRDLCRPKAR
jgi:hypothetical protein